MKESVVFLASGGLDSTVGMAKVLFEGDTVVYPLYISRGARAEGRELVSVRTVCQWLFEKYPRLIMPLEVMGATITPLEWKSAYTARSVELLGYPMRDIMLQSLGVQYAEYLNVRKRECINAVMVGQTSDEVIPHASKEALRLASFYIQLDRDDESWAIRSPLLYPELMTKGDVVKWGRAHDVPLDLTWSCFEGGKIPCGECQECRRREEAFKQCV